MLPPNTILQNRYRVVRQLGRGGIGTVYEAFDQRVNALVALKETVRASDDATRREFEREAGLLANLQHQALPKVMDYFIEGGGEYLVMEYVPGYDLLELLTRRGAPFHVELVMGWADAILDVLEYLHNHQPPILHRDIKPANLKLTKEDDLYLLDFGLAKGTAGQMPTMLTSRSVQGYTPIYSPLEQILGQGTEPRSDLYSLGATLYHLLTNVPPFDAPTRYSQLEEGRQDPLQPIIHLNQQVPKNIASTIHEAMSIRRRDRPESAAAMRQLLNRAKDEANRATVYQRHEDHFDAARQAQAESERRGEVEQQRLAEAAAWRPAEREQQKPAIAPYPFPQQQIFAAPARRNAHLIIIIAVIAVVAAIILAIALTRGTSDEEKTSANESQAASPNTTRAQTFMDNLNGVPIEMVLVPGGTFTMGSPPDEGPNDERPQHSVTLPSFYMSKYEVTQAQYRAMMGVNPSEFQGDDLPVERVTWKEAKEFCERVSSITKKEYRLPSEAEWEYAARAGTTTIFAFGNSISSSQANFDGSNPFGDAPADVNRQKTTPVGSFQPNPFGLYDMHGNVWEWCEDWYHKNYTGAPSDGSAWDDGGVYKVVRGGSWLSNGIGLRSAVRDKLDPEFRLPFVGFRVVTKAR
ncbi:MAG: bifunctional serine/threonine-protein kinase/formylglycine-generating enzyme family protein [Acidobacteriota bacterium]|nr:bifunctional serine/threonine-protein kinase/formylglycine-generating enzyme family protein [Acidobacteriota bacterium]